MPSSGDRPLSQGDLTLPRKAVWSEPLKFRMVLLNADKDSEVLLCALLKTSFHRNTVTTRHGAFGHWAYSKGVCDTVLRSSSSLYS